MSNDTPELLREWPQPAPQKTGYIQFLTDAKVRMPDGSEHELKIGDIIRVPMVITQREGK